MSEPRTWTITRTLMFGDTFVNRIDGPATNEVRVVEVGPELEALIAQTIADLEYEQGQADPHDEEPLVNYEQMAAAVVARVSGGTKPSLDDAIRRGRGEDTDE